MTRRRAITVTALGAVTAAAGAGRLSSAETPPAPEPTEAKPKPTPPPVVAAVAKKRLGLVIHSYWKRWQGKYSSFKNPPFQDALDVLDHINSYGAGSLQITLDGWTSDLARRVRETCESYGMQIEGSVQMLRHEKDGARFERDIRLGKEAGATTFRAYMGGRRYEDFSNRADFETWKAQSLKSLAWAEPILRRQQVRLGVENHKDWEVAELSNALGRISSPHLGACIDMGNSIALLEDPMTVVEALAPFVVTAHVKDMVVQECPTGFLLAEVPLGKGVLDLPALMSTIVTANPAANFHLEMITRDPLEVPCLKDTYWASFPNKKGEDLAHTLSWVRAKSAKQMPHVGSLSTEALLELEEKNIVDSFTYAAQSLHMDHPLTHSPSRKEKDKDKAEH